jgi:hypothetical protein
MKRIREFFESIAFAGLKPGRSAAAKPKTTRPRTHPVEQLLSGPAPSDPLYLSNRTASQKLRPWGLIILPFVVLALGVVLWPKLVGPPQLKPVKELSAAEITTKLLPNVDRNIKLAPPSDVQVVEVSVDGSRLVGIVQNTTTHEIAAADFVFELTNSSLSQIGAVNGTVEKIPASGRKAFQIPLKQHDAAFALVREISAR